MPMMSKATVYGTRVPRRKWRQAIPNTKLTPTKMTASVGSEDDEEEEAAAAAPVFAPSVNRKVRGK